MTSDNACECVYPSTAAAHHQCRHLIRVGVVDPYMVLQMRPNIWIIQPRINAMLLWRLSQVRYLKAARAERVDGPASRIHFAPRRRGFRHSLMHILQPPLRGFLRSNLCHLRMGNNAHIPSFHRRPQESPRRRHTLAVPRGILIGANPFLCGPVKILIQRKPAKQLASTNLM